MTLVIFSLLSLLLAQNTAVMENAEKREARLEKEKAAAVEKPAEKTGLHGKLEKAKEEMKAGDVLGKPQGKTRDTAMVM